MEIKLQDNWSEDFNYFDKNPGTFVGRRDEINSIKGILRNNYSSTILISSVRGIGKTTFIHNVIKELKDNDKNVLPVFVNMNTILSHVQQGNFETLEFEEKQNLKRELLASLIRALYEYLGESQFSDTKKLEELYQKAIGTYSIENAQEKENTKKILNTIVIDSKEDNLILASFGISLTILGISLPSTPLIRIILGIIGQLILTISFSWSREWIKSTFSSKKIKIDDSVEYLEYEFERILRKEFSKYKIIFVIDELDKVQEENVLKVIKEYKNLFTRSYAHYIFITSSEAYSLVSEKKRDATCQEGGIYPTLFTHIFYLPLPTADDLKTYLDIIFNFKDDNDPEIQEFEEYLLYSSGNDFFNLKRLLLDITKYDEDTHARINTSEVKKYDRLYFEKARLNTYITKCHLKRELKRLKLYWKDNYQLKKDCYDFLSDKLNTNFFESDYTIEKYKKNIPNLISFLKDIGAIEEHDDVERNEKAYSWIYNYKRAYLSPMTKEDKELLSYMNKLIISGNLLYNLPKIYNEKKILNSKASLQDGTDGIEFSGINLFAVQERYKDIIKKLHSNSRRVEITNEQVREAINDINTQLTNLKEKAFDILRNLLNKIFASENLEVNSDLSIGSFDTEIQSHYPNIYTLINTTDHRVYNKNNKFVVILNNFDKFNELENFHDELAKISENRDILFVNIAKIENKASDIFIKITRPDKNGKVVKRLIKMKTFMNFTFPYVSNFSDLAKIISIIKIHLIS